MIVKELKGNAVTMFLEGKGHLIHGCNCFNNMGAGIAKEIKARIPGAYDADKKTRKGEIGKLGSCSVYEDIGSGNYVFNAYTQYHFWSAKPGVDYLAIEKCFNWAAKHAIMHGWEDVPIITPLIGAGRAGGDWERIKGIINKATGQYPVIAVYFG